MSELHISFLIVLNIYKTGSYLVLIKRNGANIKEHSRKISRERMLISHLL